MGSLSRISDDEMIGFMLITLYNHIFIIILAIGTDLIYKQCMNHTQHINDIYSDLMMGISMNFQMKIAKNWTRKPSGQVIKESNVKMYDLYYSDAQLRSIFDHQANVRNFVQWIKVIMHTKKLISHQLNIHIQGLLMIIENESEHFRNF